LLSLTESSKAALPDVDPVAQQHSQAVSAKLREMLGASGGTLPFDKYMEHVLYAPGLGYYAAGATKLGGHMQQSLNLARAQAGSQRP
jgi:hypothetical protein